MCDQGITVYMLIIYHLSALWVHFMFNCYHYVSTQNPLGAGTWNICEEGLLLLKRHLCSEHMQADLFDWSINTH